MTAMGPDPITGLLQEIRTLIEEARSSVAAAVNSGLTALYWQVGDRIQHKILQEQRAEYGQQIVSSLGSQLEREFGRGFSEKSLRHMIRFAEAFPDRQIVSALLRQLTWTHFLALIYLKDPLQRQFYAEMCRLERWSTRELQNRIQSMLYERTAISRKPETVIALELQKMHDEEILSPEVVFRDPYILDFLNLADTYSERDLETAILRELERFLLELGIGFTFVARQKRMVIDHEDHYLDLLFFHRKLTRLVAVELKLGKFNAADKGQMELYLRWLARYEMEAGEEAPLGIILCAEGALETVELLQLDASGIHVAEYLTELPSREMLQQKLHAAIAHARRQQAQCHAEMPANNRELNGNVIKPVTPPDHLGVHTRLDEFRQLKDGWHEGSGQALSQTGLDWLSQTFAQQYPAQLPLPYLYPTAEGDIQAEWSLQGYEVTVEIDLEARKGCWHALHMTTDTEETRELNFQDARAWQWLAARIRELHVGGADA